MNTQQEQSQLLIDLGLDQLPEAERDELNAEIGEVILTGVMRRVLNDLDFDQQDSLMRLFSESEKEPDNEIKRTAVATFIETQVPRFTEYVQAEYQELRKVQEQALSETL